MAGHRSSRRQSRGAPEQLRGTPWAGRAASRRRPPPCDGRQLSPQIHSHATHPAVHPLHAPRMVQERDGKRVAEEPLRPRGIRRGTHTRQLGEGRQVAEAGIARRADHRRAEVPLTAVYPREERRELELPDRDVEAHGGQPGLNHLLERPFTASDGEQLEGDTPAAQQPAGRVRGRGNRAHRRVPGNARRHGTVSHRAEAEEIAVDDLAAIERERDGEPHFGVVERRRARVEHDPVRHDQRIVEHGERGVVADERGMRRLDAREIDFARRERGELGSRLVHHDDEEALERRRSAQGGREIRVGGEHPAPARLVRHEAKRSVADGMLVPGCPPQLRTGNRVEQAGGQDGQIGEEVRYGILGMGKTNHYRRIVGVIHERHVREIVQPRVPGCRVSRRRERPRDIAGRGGHTVAPAHARLQSEGEALAVFRPRPGAREVRSRHERRVVAHQGGEEDVALHLFGEGVHREQGIHALQVRSRSVYHGATAVRGSLPARRDHHTPSHQPQRSLPHARILAGLGRSPEIRRMLAHLGTRTLAGAVVVAGVVTLTFLLVRLAPGDPVERLLGPTATPAQLEAQRRALGLDRPLAAQYAIWLGRFARGDWGRSIATGRPVRALLGDAVPATLALVGTSLVLSYLLGLAVGAWQSGAGPRVDTALSIATVTLFAVPGYWLGLMLVMAFTYWAHWLPAFGAAGLDADGLTGWSRLADRLRHLALPLATLTLIGIGGAARFVRGAMLETLSQPFITTARAKGLRPRRVVGHHALRNALTPLVTMLGLSLPALFSGAVFIEAVFAWPGVGRVLVEAVRARDYPVVMAATAISAVLVVAGNMIADVLAAWVDPRVREGWGTGA